MTLAKIVFLILLSFIVQSEMLQKEGIILYEGPNEVLNVKDQKEIEQIINNNIFVSNAEPNQQKFQGLMTADQFLGQLTKENHNETMINISQNADTKTSQIIPDDRKLSDKQIVYNIEQQNKKLKTLINNMNAQNISVRVLLLCLVIMAIIYIVKTLSTFNKKVDKPSVIILEQNQQNDNLYSTDEQNLFDQIN